MPIRVRNAPLWIFFVVLIILYWLQAISARLPGWLRPVVEGLGGNVTVTLVFFVVTFWLDRRTGKQIDRIQQLATNIEQGTTTVEQGTKRIERATTGIEQATSRIAESTAASEAILKQTDRILTNERRMRRFEEFLRKESHHYVRFPEIKPTPDSLGLEYVIEPVREPQSGEPRKYEKENEVLWVIKVVGPAYWDVLTSERRAEYDVSPIREGEFYFCDFFNDSWQMSRSTIMDDPQRFHLSGKVVAGWAENANQFMTRIEDPFNKLQKLTSVTVNPKDGTPLRSGGVDGYDIYKDASGALFVGVGDSPPKKLYFTNATRTYDSSDWGVLEIEGVRGHASGEKLVNIKKAIIEWLAQLHVEIPRVPWWEAGPYKHDLD